MCLFFFLVDDTHILGHVHVIFLIFYHFASQLSYVKLFVQLCKCSAWASFGLLPGFVSLVEYYCFQGGIKILDVLFGSIFFIFSFFMEALRKYVRYGDVILRLRDVHVVFGIFFRCFVHRPSFLLRCSPPSKFSKSTCFLVHFDGRFWEILLITVP